MRKVLNKKLSNPSKKVFQRQKSCDVGLQEMTEDSSNLLKELDAFKDQVQCLRQTIVTLELDLERKDVKLAKLAREKEKLAMSLAKTKRSNESLAQQLEDERNFYFKEKEAYCNEINEYKKLKKNLSNSQVETEEMKNLRKTLEQTLQTNYNLSVKFLRMKETKKNLCRALEKSEDEHKRVVYDLRTKIESLTKDLNEVLNQKLDAPISPSNKKYLKVVNQNSSLVYENLYLQTQIDQLNAKYRNDKVQKETKPRTTQSEKVIKLYEREKRNSVPTVTFLNEKEAFRLTSPRSERKLHLPDISETKLAVFQVSEVQSSEDINFCRKRSRSAPKIVQSVSFTDSTKKE